MKRKNKIKQNQYSVISCSLSSQQESLYQVNRRSTAGEKNGNHNHNFNVNTKSEI